MKQVSLFIAGCLVGALTLWLSHPGGTPLKPSNPITAPAKDQTLSLQNELALLKTRFGHAQEQVDALKAENERVRDALTVAQSEVKAELMPPVHPPLPPIPDGSNKSVVVMNGEGIGIDITSEFITRMERKEFEANNQKELSELSHYLRLSDVQQEQLKRFMNTRQSPNLGVLSKLLSGETPSEEDLAVLMSGNFNQGSEEDLDEFLTHILGPKQLESYQDYKQEKRHNQAEVQANRELANLQSMLMLDPDQKEAAYEMFYNQSLAEPENATNTNLSPVERHLATQKQREEKLATILGEKQMEIYKRKQEASGTFVTGNGGNSSVIIRSSIQAAPGLTPAPATPKK